LPRLVASSFQPPAQDRVTVVPGVGPRVGKVEANRRVSSAAPPVDVPPHRGLSWLPSMASTLGDEVEGSATSFQAEADPPIDSYAIVSAASDEATYPFLLRQPPLPRIAEALVESPVAADRGPQSPELDGASIEREKRSAVVRRAGWRIVVGLLIFAAALALAAWRSSSPAARIVAAGNGPTTAR
jgi:hypothetical protein